MGGFMKADRTLTAAIIGALSTIPYEIFTRILMSFRYGKYSIYQLNSLIVSINRPDPVLGFVVTCIVCGFGAVVFCFALKVMETKHLVIKSVGFSLLIWGVLEAVFTGTIEGKFIEIRPMSDYYMNMMGTIVFGVTQGLLFKYLLFKEAAH